MHSPPRFWPADVARRALVAALCRVASAVLATFIIGCADMTAPEERASRISPLTPSLATNPSTNGPLPAAVWSNRGITLQKVGSYAAPQAWQVYRSVRGHRTLPVAQAALAKMGCSLPSSAPSDAFTTVQESEWYSSNPGEFSGNKYRATFTKTFIPLVCTGGRYSADLMITEEVGRKAATGIRVAYRDMKGRNPVIEELHLSRDGTKMNVAQARFGDAIIRSAQGVASDVAPTYGKAFERVMEAEAGRPVHGAIRALFDTRVGSGVPEFFAPWNIFSQVGNYEEDAPLASLTPLLPERTFKVKPKDNFFERVLRAIDQGWDDGKDALVALVGHWPSYAQTAVQWLVSRYIPGIPKLPLAGWPAPQVLPCDESSLQWFLPCK